MSDNIGQILDKWVELRGSGTLTPQEHGQLKRAVLDRGEKAPTLYRGSNMPFDRRSYGVGKPIDFGPVSTSEDIGQAEPYALNGDDKPVIFEFVNPEGLRVTDRAMDVSGYAEDEWITAGRYYVQGVRDEDGVPVVRVARSLPQSDEAQRRADTKPIVLGGPREVEPAPPTPEPEVRSDRRGAEPRGGYFEPVRPNTEGPVQDIDPEDYLWEKERDFLIASYRRSPVEIEGQVKDYPAEYQLTKQYLVRKYHVRPKRVLGRPGGNQVVVWKKKKSSKTGARSRSVPEAPLIMDTADWLTDNDPQKVPIHVALTATAEMGMPDNYTTAGFTYDQDVADGTGTTRHGIVMDVDFLSANILGMERTDDAGNPIHGQFMSSYSTVPGVAYTLTHEYGHTRDRRTEAQIAEDTEFLRGLVEQAASDESVPKWRRGPLSSYARDDLEPRLKDDGTVDPKHVPTTEAYAEAYAEWMLRGGQTNDPAVRYFADKYAWPIPEAPPWS